MKYTALGVRQVVCYTEPVKMFWQQALTTTDFFPLPSSAVV